MLCYFPRLAGKIVRITKNERILTLTDLKLFLQSCCRVGTGVVVQHINTLSTSSGILAFWVITTIISKLYCPSNSTFDNMADLLNLNITDNIASNRRGFLKVLAQSFKGHSALRPPMFTKQRKMCSGFSRTHSVFWIGLSGRFCPPENRYSLPPLFYFNHYDGVGRCPCGLSWYLEAHVPLISVMSLDPRFSISSPVFC